MAAANRVLIKQRPEPGGLRLEERELPEIFPLDVLVDVRNAAICGTDLHIYKWDAWAENAYRLPAALGHEFSGEVIAIGSQGTRVRVGDHVAAETHLACEVCSQCRNNRRHTCLNLKLFSKLGRGCFSDHAVVPEALLRVVPPSVSFEHACLMEPLGISVRTVMEVDVRARNVLIVGCGPVGLFAIAVARAAGATSILAADVVEFRLRLARDVGANVTIDTTQASLASVAAEHVKDGIDFVIDASGNGDAIVAGLAALAPGGTLVLAGMPTAPIAFDVSRDVIMKEATIRGVYGRRIDETWTQVERLLLAGTLPLDRIVKHTFALHQYDEAFAVAASGQAGKVRFAL